MQVYSFGIGCNQFYAFESGRALGHPLRGLEVDTNREIGPERFCKPYSE